MTSYMSAARPTTLLQRPGPSLARLTGIELRKSVDTRSGRWLVGLLAVLAVAVAGYLVAEQTADEPVLAARFFAVPWSVVRMLLPVLGVLSMTAEWSRRTALSTFTLVPRRGRVLVAKLAAASLVAVVSVLATGALSVLAAATAGASSGQPVRWTGLAAGLLGAFAGGVCFMALGVALGVLLQQTAAALVGYFLAPTLLTLAGTALLGDRVVWVAPTVVIIGLEELDLRGGVAPTLSALALWVVLPLAIGVPRWLRREVP